MRVLVAMSGGVDSSVAAALLSRGGHDVVGVTLKLWGGPSDSGCCSVSDVVDARRVADQLRIDHHVFNLTEEFHEAVVDPYVSEHSAGRTPNPCIECNRRVKFGVLLARARRLGFDALATGHHARVAVEAGRVRLRRGADRAKDQSYVLAGLGAAELGDVMFPVGELTKADVRAQAAGLGLRTADKPDSQDVCFIHSAQGRRAFLAQRIELRPATLVDASNGAVVGEVPAVELVTVGQRRGLGVAIDGHRRYALSVDVAARRITVGTAEQAVTTRVSIGPVRWSGRALDYGGRADAQTTAHGNPVLCTWLGDAIAFDEPQPLVAAGQTVALYDPVEPDVVLGAATAQTATAQTATADAAEGAVALATQ
jgi:tRNA-uridine 2-sulfurtransferase